MHPHIQKLHNIAGKTDRLIIGLMSGTSLDGLDVALCRISGQGMETGVELLHFDTIAYDKTYKDKIKSVFSKRQVDLQNVCLLNPWIGELHGEMILTCLQKWGLDATSIDLIASHGQTIYHSPKSLHQLADYSNATLQIGDGDHIACTTGIITCSDFRQKHIAAGGEGAPLAVYGDYLLFSNAAENRVMLNLGGIANLTYLPKSLDASHVFSSDVGPGNTMMDAFVQQHCPGQYFDENSALALQGNVHPGLLTALKFHSFFDQPLPKTTGPELFNLAYLQDARTRCGVREISPADIMATLNYFSAEMIVHALNICVDKLDSYELYASGGGVQNPLLMKNIRSLLGGKKIRSTADLNINPDAKEAVLFAILANECVAGGKTRFGNMKEGIPSITMGKISFYD
ncbi:anhydro-N-acetylmuramic acid kinase [Paremcibacter congregatus]|uniref:Anhydro-N-acetylmuramic acid kinase n=1 Tax=Paremcibacter congregatus TaxID=2043170 RepID=A0A2G4YQS7_9PROT|nr:anhydro-N-acetylmuramic acid kinase [Paremcibacter congregatus]PHZ84675.1 anhydro-N-acetylmuramic acid kinase [Paremcibacter congregatus]QDE28870.1 anhydro-N-acetylmuramic acid kinase [Paremcibacter congregatus]